MVTLYKSYTFFQNNCPACKNKNHLISECPKITFKPNHDFLIAKNNNFKFQERKANPYLFSKKRGKYKVLKNLSSVQFNAKKILLKSNDDQSFDECDSNESLEEFILTENQKNKRRMTIKDNFFNLGIDENNETYVKKLKNISIKIIMITKIKKGNPLTLYKRQSVSINSKKMQNSLNNIEVQNFFIYYNFKFIKIGD